MKPELLENKRILLIELTEEPETIIDAKNKISINPERQQPLIRNHVQKDNYASGM